MLTFEASPCQGTVAIVDKLKVCIPTLRRFAAGALTVRQGLPFQRVEHQVATIDAQPSNPNGGIIVVVSGRLLVRGLG